MKSTPRAGNGLASPRKILPLGVERKAMEKMGYRNAGAVYELSRAGKLLKPRGGKITVHTMAELVLIDMALSSYDWDREHQDILFG